MEIIENNTYASNVYEHKINMNLIMKKCSAHISLQEIEGLNYLGMIETRKRQKMLGWGLGVWENIGATYQTKFLLKL